MMTTPIEDQQDQYKLKRIHQRPYWVMLVLFMFIMYTLYLTRNVAMDVAHMCRAVAVTEEQKATCAFYWSDNYG